MRGKNAAAAAKKRADAAEERIADLERQVAALHAQHREDTNQRDALIVSLRSKLTNDVHHLSDVAIRAAQEEAQLQAEREAREAKAAKVAAVRLLWDAWQKTDLVSMDPLLFAEFLKRLKIHYRDLGITEDDNPGDGKFDKRYQRRLTASEYGKNLARIAEYGGGTTLGLALQRRSLGISGGPDLGGRNPGLDRE